MAAIGEGADRANITGKDLAAALAPDKGRAPVLNKDVMALRERYRKDAGESVFQAELAQNEEDLMVNFDEMRRVLDSERKRVDTETDKKRKDVLKKRYDRLELRFGMYDKLLNNEGLNAMDEAEKQELVGTMARLPGFAEATALATGGRLSAEQMMRILEGKGGVSLTKDEKRVIDQMVANVADDDRFKNRLSKNLSTNVMDENDYTSVTKIEGLRVKQKQDEQEEKDLDKFKKTKKDYESAKSEDEIESLQQKYDVIQRTLNRIDENYRPVSFDDAEIKAKIKVVDDQIKSIVPTTIISTGGGASTSTSGLTPEQDAQKRQLAGYLSSLQSIESSVGANGQSLTEFKKYADSLAKIKKFEDGAGERNTRMQELTQEEGKRSKYLDKYKRKMEVALSEEMKRYWNEVTLTNAGKSADAQAAIKAEEKAAEQKEKDLRIAKTKELLDRFMQMSYLKYENGQAKGWDDAAIKQFAKKDILSRSPKQISRDMIDRIIRNRAKLPRAYGKEIDAMLKEMGIGKGEPPAAARDVLNSIDGSQYEKWAEEKMPDLMGYAWARGYYFDRMKITPAQAEFLQRAYKEDFFANALSAKEGYANEAATLMGGEFMSGGAITKEKIKDMLGKDWVGGSKKLMKLLAYAGAGYTLAGGFAWGLDSAGLALGGKQVLANLNAAKLVGGQILTGASKLGNVALHNTLGNATIAEMSQRGLGAYNAQLAADVAAGTITADQAAKLAVDVNVPGPDQAGGLIQKLTEASRATSGLNVNGPKP